LDSRKARRKGRRKGRSGSFRATQTPKFTSSVSDSISDFLFRDTDVRRQFDFISISSGTLIGICFGEWFGWNERTVVLMILAFSLFATIIPELRVELSKLSSLRTGPAAVNEPLKAVMPVCGSKGLRVTGVLAVAALFVLKQLPVDAIEPEVTAWWLRKTDLGILPDSPASLRMLPLSVRFQNEADKVNDALKNRRAGNAEELASVKTRLQNVVANKRLPPSVYDAAVAEITGLQGLEVYTRVAPNTISVGSPQQLPAIPHTSFTLLGPGQNNSNWIYSGSDPRAFAVSAAGFITGIHMTNAVNKGSARPIPFAEITRLTGVGAVFDQSTIDGFAQNLAGITWTRDTFKDCVISVGEGPLYLSETRFLNCRFEDSLNPENQKIVVFLRRNGEKPVTLYRPN